MNLFEYIKSQLPRPNTSVMYNLGASEEIVDYVRHTTWNTNLNIIKDMCESEDGYTIADYLAAIPEEGDYDGFENAIATSENEMNVDLLDISLTISIETNAETGSRITTITNIHYNSQATDPSATVPTDINNAITEAIIALDAEYINTYINNLQEPTVIPDEG